MEEQMCLTCRSLLDAACCPSGCRCYSKVICSSCRAGGSECSIVTATDAVLIQGKRVISRDGV